MTQPYPLRGAVGWEPAISQFKAAVEAALAGTGGAVLPPPGQPPRNLADGDELPAFVFLAPPGLDLPARPAGVFAMAEATAAELQRLLA